MQAERTVYLAYLLRIWRARGLWGVTWRVSLEDVETHELRGFRDLAALGAFLREALQEKRTED